MALLWLMTKTPLVLMGSRCHLGPLPSQVATWISANRRPEKDTDVNKIAFAGLHIQITIRNYCYDLNGITTPLIPVEEMGTRCLCALAESAVQGLLYVDGQPCAS